MEKGRIRILELIDDAGLGGGQIHVLTLAKYLDRTRFDVTVGCEPTGYLVEETEKLGLRHIPVKMDNNLSLRALRETAAMFQKYEFDLLHTHGGTAGFWGRTAAVLLGRPPVRVHSYHGMHYLHSPGFRNGLFRLIDSALLGVTQKVICVCRSDYENGMEAGIVNREKGEIILYGIETDRFKKANLEASGVGQTGRQGDAIIFGNVGRLHIQKGQKYLLEAFSRLKASHPPVRLWIIGGGELETELKQLASSLGIAGSVEFLGSRRDIPELLAAFDVFVLPSLWEGQPISLLEAMVASKPVIASSVDGIADILVDHKNALLVPPADPVALERAMAEMISSCDLRIRLSESAARTAAEDFSAERMAERIGNLYESLMKKREPL